MSKLLIKITSVSALFASQLAVASTAPPVAIPEPGSISLIAAGAVGVILFARYLRRK